MECGPGLNLGRRVAAILSAGCPAGGRRSRRRSAAGVANPSGKLAETIPVRVQDNSSYLNFPGEEGVVQYGEGTFIGYRAYDTLIQHVSYPFGFDFRTPASGSTTWTCRSRARLQTAILP